MVSYGMSFVSYSLYNQVVGGTYWFQSVRPSVRPAFRVRSVAPTVLVGSISYLDVLSRHFRRCAMYKVFAKIKNFNFWQFFQICNFDLSFVLTWDLMWITSMGNHGAVGVGGWWLSQNAGVLVHCCVVCAIYCDIWPCYHNTWGGFNIKMPSYQ